MYGNVDDWIAYALARGEVVADDAASAAALVRVSDYIRLRYVMRMTGVEDDDPAIIEATYIAASVDLAEPGFWTGTYDKDDATVMTKVGDIQWTPIPGINSNADAMQPTSPMIDALLTPLGAYGTAVFVV
ncbi:MAG: hypothetical protein JKY94_11235 [Rhodobacteraceae bacterium]|nr:hypothetical protein [Paracoccaceae bacterium]